MANKPQKYNPHPTTVKTPKVYHFYFSFTQFKETQYMIFLLQDKPISFILQGLKMR